MSERVIGIPISRSQALQKARQILEEAENERRRIDTDSITNSLRLLKMLDAALPSDTEALRKEVIELRAARVKDAEKIQACADIVQKLYEALLRGEFARAKMIAIAGAQKAREMMQ